MPKEEFRGSSFAQIYPKYIPKLYVLNGSELKLLLAMVKRMYYGGENYNLILITRGVKKNIASETKLSERYISNIMHKLIEKKMIKKIANTEYIINPYIFWRGASGKRDELFENENLTYFE
ncbi:MAG: replication/maintenance protein RepL [bacterium]